MIAARYGRTKTVRLLHSLGANIRAASSFVSSIWCPYINIHLHVCSLGRATLCGSMKGNLPTSLLCFFICSFGVYFFFLSFFFLSLSFFIFLYLFIFIFLFFFCFQVFIVSFPVTEYLFCLLLLFFFFMNA